MKLATRVAGLVAITIGQSCMNAGPCPLWPEPSAELNQPEALLAASSDAVLLGDDEAVRALPVCVASEQWSAGELGRSVLYQVKRVGDELHVGYFVYWTTERPWGNNLLSYLVLPAIFVDSFYSHLFFLFPGFQRFIHGPGDVEGARVVYRQKSDGRWTPVSAVADNGFHQEVHLEPADFVDEQGRVVLMTDVWSHQLGAKGARTLEEIDRDRVVCFEHDGLRPMTEGIADSFRLGTSRAPRRAVPAWRL